jgi:hypothetical protein
MIPLFLAFAIFGVVGVLLTGWPGRVREFIIDACVRGRWGFWIGRNIILRRVRKPGYILELRLIGIVALCGAVACAWVFLGGKLP